jgi:hypothetical protein
MNLAHAERRPALFLPVAIAAVLFAALAFAVAAFVVTLTDDDGTTVVREVSVTPAAEAPAHFSERPDESAVAAAVGRAHAGLNPAAQQYGTSQYRVNPSTGYAEPSPGGSADGGPEEGR